jgi:hypothetical protein
MTRKVVLSDGRHLALLSLEEAASATCTIPFAALLPAFHAGERTKVRTLVPHLLLVGCREFCSVGPEAEILHDEIDSIVEAQDSLDVVTTWHTELLDACEYFVWAAGGRKTALFAVTSDHSDLDSLLLDEMRGENE